MIRARSLSLCLLALTGVAFAQEVQPPSPTVDLHYSEGDSLPSDSRASGMVGHVQRVADLIFGGVGEEAEQARAGAALQAFARVKVVGLVDEEQEPWRVTFKAVAPRLHIGGQIRPENQEALRREYDVMLARIQGSEALGLPGVAMPLTDQQRRELQSEGELELHVPQPFRHLRLWQPKPDLRVTVRRQGGGLLTARNGLLRRTAYAGRWGIKSSTQRLLVSPGEAVTFESPESWSLTWRFSAADKAVELRDRGAAFDWDPASFELAPGPVTVSVAGLDAVLSSIDPGFHDVFELEVGGTRRLVLLSRDGRELASAQPGVSTQVALSSYELQGALVAAEAYPARHETRVERRAMSAGVERSLQGVTVGADPTHPVECEPAWGAQDGPLPDRLTLTTGAGELRAEITVARRDELHFEEDRLVLFPGSETSGKSDAAIRDLTLVVAGLHEAAEVGFEADAAVVEDVRVVGRLSRGVGETEETVFKVRVRAARDAQPDGPRRLEAFLRSDRAAAAEIPVLLQPFTVAVVNSPPVHFASSRGVYWVKVQVRGPATEPGADHDAAFTLTGFTVEFRREGERVLPPYVNEAPVDPQDYFDSRDGWLALFVPPEAFATLQAGGTEDDVSRFELKNVQAEVTVTGRFDDGPELTASAARPVLMDSLWTRDLQVVDLGHGKQELELTICEEGRGFVETECRIGWGRMYASLAQGRVSFWSNIGWKFVDQLGVPTRYVAESSNDGGRWLERRTEPAGIDSSDSSRLWDWNFESFLDLSETRARATKLHIEAKLGIRSWDRVAVVHRWTPIVSAADVSKQPLFDQARARAHTAGHVLGTYFGVAFPLIPSAQDRTRIKGVLDSDPRQHSLYNKNAVLSPGYQLSYSYSNTTALALGQEQWTKQGDLAQLATILLRIGTLLELDKLKKITTAVTLLFDIATYMDSFPVVSGPGRSEDWNKNTAPLEPGYNGAAGRVDLLLYEYRLGRLTVEDLSPEVGLTFPPPGHRQDQPVRDERLALLPIQRALQPNAVYAYLLHSQVKAWGATHGQSKVLGQLRPYDNAQVGVELKFSGKHTLTVEAGDDALTSQGEGR